jgi:D-alanyl-D-alanine carboxypeptidase/D-alanyl-D-alanine-endopeptidase (penicillin-binding protein 4)
MPPRPRHHRLALIALLALGAAVLAPLSRPDAASATSMAPTTTTRTAAATRAEVAKKVSTALKGIGAHQVDYDFSIDNIGSVTHDAQTATAPASNEKIFTAATALHVLGPSYRYATVVAGTSPVADHVLHGDLVLRGSGDPTLTMDSLLAMAKRLHAKGLHHVTGHLVVDDTRYSHQTREPGWKHDFVPVESGTVDAFTVDENEWRGGSSFEADPTRANAAIWRKELKRAHISVAGSTRIEKAPAGLHRLVKHQSATLASILVPMMHESINFYAEMLLRELGAYQTGHGSAATGLAAIKGFATNFDLPFGTAHDGSGLSYDDRQTPATIIDWLKTQPIGGDFYYSLPLSCASGTLEYRLCAASVRDRVRAKTGTLDHVSALSGYFETESGDEVTFSVLVSGFPDSKYQRIYNHVDAAVAAVSKHG